MPTSPPSPPAAADSHQTPKIFFSCTGVDIWRGGIETFFRECFDNFRSVAGFDIQLFKGPGPEAPGEHRLWCLPRTGGPAKFLGRCMGRNAYVVEQLTSFFPLVRQIRAQRPDIVFTSDGNLLMQLFRRRRWIGVPFRLIYSNGAPVSPPFLHCDHVQEVTPFYFEQSIKAGEPPERHSMVPYGIRVPPGEAAVDAAAREQVRRQLGLPAGRAIVISAGWISPTHKRMDYVVREVAALPEPRPFLLLVGRMDASSQSVLSLARELLGEANFAARSVPYEQMPRHYQASDLFVLASLTEGFGRVFLEALIEGLPCIAHDQAVMRYVLGDRETFVDMSRPGALAGAMASALARPTSPEAAAARRNRIRATFSWEVLAPAYRDMFRACMANDLADH
ncbi:MAG: glycosyltransferase family 4 protein [Tepidisphaeraceae bacterium]|jgi:glycosyltransferase involved in cell wall biosynthesis